MTHSDRAGEGRIRDVPSTTPACPGYPLPHTRADGAPGAPMPFRRRRRVICPPYTGTIVSQCRDARQCLIFDGYGNSPVNPDYPPAWSGRLRAWRPIHAFCQFDRSYGLPAWGRRLGKVPIVPARSAAVEHPAAYHDQLTLPYGFGVRLRQDGIDERTDETRHSTRGHSGDRNIDCRGAAERRGHLHHSEESTRRLYRWRTAAHVDRRRRHDLGQHVDRLRFGADLRTRSLSLLRLRGARR